MSSAPFEEAKSVEVKQDEDMEDEEEGEDSDEREEEDEDEWVESRPLTPDSERSDMEEDKKTDSGNRVIMGATQRGAFTWKIVKKKAQDLEKGKIVAFGSTAQRTDDLSTQQILERNKKIQKHYQGPYKKKKHISLYWSLPKNLEEQKTLFFESEFTVNPQFIYENENVTKKYLRQFYSENSKSPEGIPQASSELLKLATKILKAWIKEYGTETEFLQSEGDILTREETEKVSISLFQL